MEDLVLKMKKIGIIPVVKIDDAKDAVPLAKALSEGGIDCAEITFRTAAARQAIENIHKALPDFFIAAGTVLNKTQAKAAIDAGASLIVSPGLSEKTVEYCKEMGFPIIPGIATPSELQKAIELGLECVKFFPAEAAGGINMIKSLSAPFPNIRFMPTGGINAKNLKDYMALKSVFCCGGSWMVPSDKIASGDFMGITKLCLEAKALLGEI